MPKQPRAGPLTFGSLNDYAQAFDKALEEGKEFTNFNRDIQHATVIICIALAHAHAKKRVRLLSHMLDPMLYSGQWFLEEAKGFLDRGGELQILVETEISEDHAVYGLAGPDTRLSVRCVPPDIAKSYKFNFMLVDDLGYRFESDREKHEAVVSFGSETGSQIVSDLGNVFDSLWAQGKSVL